MDIKTPPHSLEAEQSVLGAIFIDKDAIVDVVGFLKPEHFYDPRHQDIYRLMLDLYEERAPVDATTITERLKAKKLFAKVGGGDYLKDLINTVPTAANIEKYSKITRDYWTRRQLIFLAGQSAEIATDESRDLKEVIDQTEKKIFELSQAQVERYFRLLKDSLADSFDRLAEIAKNPEGLRGVPTGFKDLDNILTGMQDSNLLILAARPGIGKTAFILNIAQYVAVEKHLPVGIFSLEMSVEELQDRLLESQAEIDAWKLKSGKLNDDDFDRLQEAFGVLGEAPIYIDDTPGMSILEMRTKARRLMAETDNKLKLLIVDYLQLADCGRRTDSRVTEVSMISQSLKNLARELKIPVIAVSQLSRAVEHRGDPKPQLADLRESGAIEQDADVVMFLYRPAEEKSPEEEVASEGKIRTKLLIAKHRNGPSQMEIDFMFVGPRLKFYGVERKRT